MGVCPKLMVFLEYCKSNDLPLDFCAVTSYGRVPEEQGKAIRMLRAALDRHGFAKTETEISEWHYWTKYRFYDLDTFDAYVEELTGLDSAAYTTATLTCAQDAPVDHMFFYAANVNYFGIFDPLCYRPRPPYYALRDFAKVVHGAVRVPCPASPARGWYVMATRDDNGCGHLLVSALGARGELRLELKGVRACAATSVVRRGEPCAFTDFAFENGVIRVAAPRQGAVYRFSLELNDKEEVVR